ncbi:uncharacterized protein [Medicago truncatula]|nr:uncharacterized protein LOC25498594 [Medicago truncatula]KEH23006.1 DUF674 family protein [Medicago truncatula]
MKPTIGWSSRIFGCDVENAKAIQFTIKLVIRKSDGKILYAQGDREFADLLLSFLTFPLGGVVRMFGGKCSLGSIDALYHSIVDLDENKYFVTKEAKNKIVDPHLAPQFNMRNQILPIRQPREKFYCHDDYDITCKNIDYFDCTKKVVFFSSFDGYVKGTKTYVATDDLVVKESSPTSVLNLINHFRTPLNDLKEKVINIGINECLSILKASLTSTEALTNGLGHLVTEVQEGKLRSVNIF